jgi:hypothetical protein
MTEQLSSRGFSRLRGTLSSPPAPRHHVLQHRQIGEQLIEAG